MKKLTLPISDEAIRDLKVGEPVLLSGVMMTGRDAVHKWMNDRFIAKKVDPSEDDLAVYEAIKPILDGGIIYHCGPVVVKEKGKWVVKAAGPTTSIREEPYQGPLMEQFGIRAVIGKGGMGPKTLEYLKKVGGVYFHAIGGAAQVLAERVVEVSGVHMAKELGAPEAIWEFVVEKFPVVVTMDSHGKSLHDQVMADSQKRLKKLMD